MENPFDDDPSLPKTITKELRLGFDELFGYKIYGNYHLVKFSQMLKFTDFTLKNRGIDNNHVNEIYNTLKLNKKLTMPPIELISVILPNIDEDKIYVGNGQHRFLAYKKLYELDKIDLDVMCMIHDADNEEQMDSIIKIINSGKPVTTMFNFKERNEFIEKIGSAYENIYSKSENHHADKMNKIRLRDILDNNKIFDGKRLANDMFNKLITFNEIIKKEFESKIKTVKERELFNKIKESHKFYCLMCKDYTWVNRFQVYVSTIKIVIVD